MYSPRSSKKRSKTTRKQRRSRIWSWINISLMVLITILLIYYFYSGHARVDGAPPDSGAQETPAAAVSPPPQASPAASAIAVAPSPSPKATAKPSPAAASPAAVPSAEASPSAAPPASADQAADATASEASPSSADTPQTSGDAGEAPASADAAPPDEGSGGVEEIAGLPAGEKGAVTISFAGDVMFAGKVGELLGKQGYGYPYGALNGLFQIDDLSIVNLETPVTTRGTAANKTYVYQSSPQALGPLKAAGIDAVNLANNHTLDKGEQGLLDTLNNLNKAGIPYVGAGKNASEAYSAQYFKRNGVTIALLGFTRVMPEASWAAGKNKPGVASAYSLDAAVQAIAAAKKKADIVAVVVHWGQERVDNYSELQQSMGHSFIDAGADLVIGGHPHVLQGIEPYKGKWIAYSTGNFIFTRSATKTTWESAVFQAKCTTTGQCSMKLVPVDAELGRPVPMNATSSQALLKRMESLSVGRVKISKDGMVTEAGR